MTLHHPQPAAATTLPGSPATRAGSRSPARRLARYAGYAAAWVFFIAVARLVVPQTSGAAQPPTSSSSPSAPGLDAGSLVGREYIVRVHVTADGPRYTVCRADGTVIRAGLDQHTLAETFPALDPGAKHASPTRLMTVESE